MDSITLATAEWKGHTYAVLIDPTANTARVTSKSDPAVTHVVTADGCDCIAFQWRRRCSHVEAVSKVQQERRARQLQTVGV